MQSNRLIRNVNRLLLVVWGVLMAFVLTINMLKSHFEFVNSYYYTFQTLLPHPALMLLGWLGLSLIYLVFSKLWKGSSAKVANTRSKNSPLWIFFLLFFVLQLFLIYNYFFETNWDVQVCLNTARQMAYGGDINEYSWYYSMYPNNLFLTRIFSVILFIAKPLHLGNQDLFAIIIVQSALCVFTAMMLYQLCLKMWNSEAMAVFSLTVYLILVGLSPWISITYSDAWALPFPVLLLWLWHCIDWKGKVAFKWLTITFLAWIGFKIKPQVCFVFVALLLVEGIAYWTKYREVIGFKALITQYMIPIAIGLALGFGTTFVAVKSTHIQVVESRTMGASHFLMMGLNPKSLGGYSDDDVVFSYSFSSTDERTKANLEESKSRLQQMGVGGFAKLMCQKNLVNYYDGTFFWGHEGGFYKIVFPLKNSHLSPFVRNVYYNGEPQGDYYPQWCTFVTALWLGVLALAFFASFGKWPKSLKIIALMLLFLTFYESLFEARARYFFAFAPCYIMMAAQGANVLASWCGRLLKKAGKD